MKKAGAAEPMMIDLVYVSPDGTSELAERFVIPAQGGARIAPGSGTGAGPRRLVCAPDSYRHRK
jgi:hypothetical protein